MFAGDVAIAELRTKLALAPDRLPEPPPPASAGSKLVWSGRIAGVVAVVAVGFVGYQWGSSSVSRLRLPHATSHPRQAAAPQRSVTALTDQGLGSQQPVAQDRAAGATVMNAVPAVYPPPTKAGPPAGRTSRPLTVAAVPPQQADDAAQLAISASDAEAGAGVVIGGLAPGSTLSAGRPVAPNTWRLSVDELAGASIIPPRGFVGVMDLTIELRLADNSTGDRKGLQVEWLARDIAANPQVRQHDAAEIAQMLKRGADLMANGDVAAARLMYQRAAEAGEAAAAFALAETYDPLVLDKGGVAPDIGLAQTWYKKARDLGSPQAPDRLDRLAQQLEEK